MSFEKVNPFSSNIRLPFAAVAARWITTKLYDGIDPNHDNFKDLRDQRDKSGGESCGGADVDDSSFHISNVGTECAISLGVCRASKNERDVFLLHLLPPFPAGRASLIAKHEKRLVALEAFQVGRLELFTRKDSNPLLHHCATTAATANVFRPKRGASPPS